MNFKLTFTSNEDIMEKYGSTQGRSISTNKIVEFVNPPRPNASVMDEASHRVRPKMSRMQGVPDCCFRQHGISDYQYSLSSAHLVTRQISDLPLMCQVPQISELG